MMVRMRIFVPTRELTDTVVRAGNGQDHGQGVFRLADGSVNRRRLFKRDRLE
jgi:hypothetical protein